MEKKLSYRVPLLSNCGFDAVFKNKSGYIEITNIETFGNYWAGNAYDLRNTIVSRYSDEYTSPSGSTKEGRKIIRNQVQERINRKHAEIEELRLIIEMCKKDKVIITQTP